MKWTKPIMGDTRQFSGFLFLPVTGYDSHWRRVTRWLENAEWEEFFDRHGDSEIKWLDLK